MNWNCDGRVRCSKRIAWVVLGFSLAMGLGGARGWAQGEPGVAKPDTETVQIFLLTNVSQPNDGNGIVDALRTSLRPGTKVSFSPMQNAIVVRATPDQLPIAQKLIHDLDRAKKTYRLTYTIVELDDGKRVGTQHFTVIVGGGLRTTLKQGSRIPIMVSSTAPSPAGLKTDVTYLDVGVNIDATLDESASGVRLRSKLEQSSVAEEKSGMGGQDPIIRQTFLEGTSFLTLGKPAAVGSADVPGSTRHLDVEVVAELVR